MTKSMQLAPSGPAAAAHGLACRDRLGSRLGAADFLPAKKVVGKGAPR